MLLVSLLVISLVLLFGYSISRERGKNTKFARKGADAMAQQQTPTQSIDTSGVIEIN
ncbi:MAG: hypothetical protein ACJAXM_000336 [Arenicella sp.]|jgi:hypothetical protein